jgi:hypothetical protein
MSIYDEIKPRNTDPYKTIIEPALVESSRNVITRNNQSQSSMSSSSSSAGAAGSVAGHGSQYSSTLSSLQKAFEIAEQVKKECGGVLLYVGFVNSVVFF